MGALDLTKGEFIAINNSAPDTLYWIASAASKGHPLALNRLADMGALDLTKDEFLTIEQNNPYTLKFIASTASKGYPDALNKLADMCALDLTKNEFIAITNSAPETLYLIARVAHKGHPLALNRLADMGALDLTKDEFITIEQNNPYTLRFIASTASKGYPGALNKLADMGALNLTQAEFLSIKNSAPNTLGWIAYAAYKGHPLALDKLMPALQSFTKDEFTSQYAGLGLLPYLTSPNTQLFEALKSQFLPLTSEEFVSILHRQDNDSDTYRIGKNIGDSTFGSIIEDKVDLSSLEEDHRNRISFLISAGQAASKNNVKILSESDTFQVTPRSYEGYEQRPYFHFSIAQLLHDNPPLAKQMLSKLAPDYLTEHAGRILESIPDLTRVSHLAPILNYFVNSCLELTIPRNLGYALSYQIHLCIHMKKRYDQIYSVVQSLPIRKEPIEIMMPIHLAQLITCFASRPKQFKGIEDPKPDFFIGDRVWHQKYAT
jgi:hypothetical protein